MEVQAIEIIFNRCGFPGCVASKDGVHVELGSTSARDKHLYVGKEGYPTVAFNVCVGHEIYIPTIHIYTVAARLITAQGTTKRWRI
jgi:hypothetical protein